MSAVQMSTYRASMDWFVWGLTAGLTVLLVGVVIGLGIAFVRIPQWPIRVLVGLSMIICVSILVGAYLYSPRAYRLGDSELIIERPVGDVAIPLASVRSVTPNDDWVGLSRKTLPGGNSGLFGIYGTFHNKTLGDFRMYAQRARGAVVIGTDHELIVVTPDERERFIRELTERRGQDRG